MRGRWKWKTRALPFGKEAISCRIIESASRLYRWRVTALGKAFWVKVTPITSVSSFREREKQPIPCTKTRLPRVKTSWKSLFPRNRLGFPSIDLIEELDRKFLPALSATLLNNRLTGFGTHALQKPVAASTAAGLWLIGSFRHNEKLPNNKSSIWYP